MRFFIHKRRQTPTIIIVALIDVLIVLVIFLMVTTTFKQQQPALRLALPESSQAHDPGANENAPEIVSIDAKGDLHFGVDAVPVTEDRLREKLLNEIARNPDLKLALSADKAAPFGQIVKVMDIAKEAKIKMVSAFTKEEAKP